MKDGKAEMKCLYEKNERKAEAACCGACTRGGQAIRSQLPLRWHEGGAGPVVLGSIGLNVPATQVSVMHLHYPEIESI